MKRRQWLQTGCAVCASLAAGGLWAQDNLSYTPPQKLGRPDPTSDEGGLWALMEREERNLRRSGLLLRDGALNRYIQNLACSLGGDHCSDIRVYVVRAPQFNATMAPNGAMQVWSGLLLRVANEAQLAAVLGHEIGHYLQRHSLARLRDIRDKAALGQVLGLFGVAGLVGQMAVFANAYAYQRDHEREADRIGAILMHQAGYSVEESAHIWDGLSQEMRAQTGAEAANNSPLFATHPPTPERRDSLLAMAQRLPGGTAGADAYLACVAPFLEDWCEDEIKRRQFAESIALFGRLMAGPQRAGLMRCYRGEAYRLRGAAGDADLALEDYRQATEAQASSPPVPKAYRGIGLIERQRQRRQEAAQAFQRYLELAPGAPDAGLIRSYLEDMNT